MMFSNSSIIDFASSFTKLLQFSNIFLKVCTIAIYQKIYQITSNSFLIFQVRRLYFN